MGYINTGMGDNFSALLVSVMALWLCFVYFDIVINTQEGAHQLQFSIGMIGQDYFHEAVNRGSYCQQKSVEIPPASITRYLAPVSSLTFEALARSTNLLISSCRQNREAVSGSRATKNCVESNTSIRPACKYSVSTFIT